MRGGMFCLAALFILIHRQLATFIHLVIIVDKIFAKRLDLKYSIQRTC